MTISVLLFLLVVASPLAHGAPGDRLLRRMDRALGQPIGLPSFARRLCSPLFDCRLRMPPELSPPYTERLCSRCVNRKFFTDPMRIEQLANAVQCVSEIDKPPVCSAADACAEECQQVICFHFFFSNARSFKAFENAGLLLFIAVTLRSSTNRVRLTSCKLHCRARSSTAGSWVKGLLFVLSTEPVTLVPNFPPCGRVFGHVHVSHTRFGDGPFARKAQTTAFFLPIPPTLYIKYAYRQPLRRRAATNDASIA